MTATLDFLDRPHAVLDGPTDTGVEQRWRVQLDDGTVAVAAQLVADLARDESIRRRYLRDLRRVLELDAACLAPTLAHGPAQAAEDPQSEPPWRLRVEPAGESLDQVLARAPLQLEECSAIFCAVADAVHSVHIRGAVLRDLRPEHIRITPDAGVLLVDVGLARVDVLSSHTASSLMLQGSTYAAPEQLYKTAIDQRSDVFSVGAMMYQALAGELPYPGGPSFLREDTAAPSLLAARGDVPPIVDELVTGCLAHNPDERPPSIAEISWVFRGGGSLVERDELTTCQHCETPLRVGQRLCLSCGRLAVRFEHTSDRSQSWGIDLVSLSEDEKPLRWLEEFLHSVSQPPFFKPQFIIGSVHLYDEDERVGRLRLPTRLYSDIGEDTANALHSAMSARGLRVRVVSPHASRRAGALFFGALVATIAASVLASAVGISVAWTLVPGLLGCVGLLAVLHNRVTDKRAAGRFRLRSAPAALPASDPLVARLSELLGKQPPADVRPVIASLALVVQRLVDHRAALARGQEELDALTAPLEPLIGAVERHVERLTELSEELSGLEEGAMVRALAVAEARDEGPARRSEILQGLDRLRTLEEQRAAAFHRLLEVKSLLNRTVRLGLNVQDAQAQHDRSVALALATLEG